MILTLKEWLHANDLFLSHPGQGHNDGDMPVMFSELERLDAKVRIVVEDSDE
jgi:hypothetical protein